MTCLSFWNRPLLPVKIPRTSDSHEYNSSRETGAHCLGPEKCILQPSTGRGESVIITFKWTEPERGYSAQFTWARLPQGYKNSPTLFDEPLNTDPLPFCQRFLRAIFLEYGDDPLLASKTRIDYKRATEELLQEVQNVTMGYRTSAKKAQLCIRGSLSWLPAEGRQIEPLSEWDYCHPSDSNSKD